MLLIDQVEMLRENLASLQYQEFALPLLGDVSATRRTYQFKSLIHPARDIATIIAIADPAGNKLPRRLRGWNVGVIDELEVPQKIALKDLLGMIIHAYYLRIGDGDLDISNDFGKRLIVPYQEFLKSVKRMLLSPDETCLVICNLVEKQMEQLKKKHSEQKLEGNMPGLGDLQFYCLPQINRWPTLRRSLWETFFSEADERKTVGLDYPVVRDKPFVTSWHFSNETLLWHIGWAAGNVFAKPWVDVLHLARVIKSHFDLPRPQRP